MNAGIIIVAIIVLALFIVPLISFGRSGKKKQE